MSKVQEYLFNGEYVTIAYEVKDKPEFVVVVNDREELLVARRESLQKKEDSWGFKRAEERAVELRNITAKAQENLDAVVEKVIKKATGALASRMKFNILFGDNMKDGGWALTIANELEKLVKKDAEEVVKGIEK